MPFNPTSANFHHAFIYVFVRQNYKVNDRRPSWKSETLPLFASNTAMPEVKSTKYKTVKNIQHHTCSALHGHILAALSSELVPWGYRKICRKKSLIEKLISVRKPKQSPSLLLYHKPVSTIFTFSYKRNIQVHFTCLSSVKSHCSNPLLWQLLCPQLLDLVS